MIPELAEDIRWNENYTSLKVGLKNISAEDVLYTFETVNKLQIGDFSESLKSLKNIQVESPNIVVFNLDRFDRAFLNLLSQLPVISRTENRFTGEFTIESQGSEEVVLRRKMPSDRLVNRIVVKQMPSTRKSIRELVAGNVDITFLASEWDFKVLTDLQEIQVGELKSRMLYLVLQNFKNPGAAAVPWAAINRNIDRKAIIEKMGEEGFAEASLPIPKDDPVWGEALPTPSALGESSSASLGAGNLTATLSYLGRKSRDEHLALILKRYLEEMGIQIVLKERTWETFASELSEKRFDWILFPYNFKDTLMENWGFHSPEGSQSSNLSNYSNPRFDRFLEEARYTREDAAAKAAFRNAMAELAEHPPGLFLFWLKTSIIYRKSCSGFKYNTNEFFSSLKDVRCEPSAAN
ncbi:MAG: ABC transporter substrate-binding protein [bacterium]